MASLRTLVTGATAVAGIVRTLTDPEMVERISKLAAGLRERQSTDRAAALRKQATGLSEQLEFLNGLIDNDDERQVLAGLGVRLRRVMASLPAAELASGGRQRAMMSQLSKALDALTREAITLMVGEAIEDEEPAKRRPTLRALRRARDNQR